MKLFSTKSLANCLSVLYFSAFCLLSIFGATNRNSVYLIGDEELMKLSPACLDRTRHSTVDTTTEISLRINNGIKHSIKGTNDL